jgi:hypothetical protein
LWCHQTSSIDSKEEEQEKDQLDMMMEIALQNPRGCRKNSGTETLITMNPSQNSQYHNPWLIDDGQEYYKRSRERASGEEREFVCVPEKHH